MKHFISILFTILFINAHGQLKTIPTAGNGTKGLSYAITNPPLVQGNMSRTFPAFAPKQIAAIGFNLEQGETVNGLLYDVDGTMIAANIKLNFIGRSAQTSLQKAQAVSNVFAEIWGIDEYTSFTEISSNLDELGLDHVKFQQTYKQIPVFGKEIILHGRSGNFDYLNGRVAAIKDIDVTPSIEASAAEAIAIKQAGSIYDGVDKFGIFNFKPIISELVLYPTGKEIVLAYHTTIYTDLVHRWEYFINAHTGEIVAKYENICKFHNHNTSSHEGCNHTSHVDAVIEPNAESTMIFGPEKALAIDLLGQQREIDTYLEGSRYYLIDASREMFSNSSNMPNDPIGAIWTIDAFNTSPQTNNFDYDHVKSNNNTWNDRSSVSAHYNGAKAYLYFRNLHTRNSINGSGGNIVSFINVADEDGRSMDNAFWNGAAMFYGNGSSAFKPLAAGLDVAGHEMSHGVIQNTANLTYQGESGALNESFADIFGAMIDRDDWLIGEDVVNVSAFPSGALRSLIDPHNGAATGDFGSGWQPKRYSERYTGSQDNGGVHINSGIPNHAFYLFATDTRLGANENDRKLKAEKVFYRALSQYLTKSSQFVDCRVAVQRAAKELYGDQVEAAAKTAFDKVEIPGGGGGTYQNDAETNPGSDLILFTTQSQNNLYIYTIDGTAVAEPLTETNPISKPSVTDAGDAIVFIGDDKKIKYISIDWNASSAEEQTLNTGSSLWRNCAISKDGRLLAALSDNVTNELVVFDLTNGNGITYELTNPTFTTGVSTGDVLYADVMEFDYTNEYVMYDANNRLKSSTAGDIEYWDIGFIKVWNDDAKTFALPDQISKLFQGLPEGVSVGNPTFSKNSNYIIAFDFIDENGDVSIYGANIETGDIGLVFENVGLGYPSYSRTDEQVIFDYQTNIGYDLGVQDLQSDKINAKGGARLLFEDVRWGVWFSNGERDFTSVIDHNIEELQAEVSPNPANALLNFSFNAKNSGTTKVTIIDGLGKKVLEQELNYNNGENNMPINLHSIASGTYMLHTEISGKVINFQFVKM